MNDLFARRNVSERVISALRELQIEDFAYSFQHGGWKCTLPDCAGLAASKSDLSDLFDMVPITLRF